MSTKKLTHVDSEGRSRMVDVTGKEPTRRVARAEAFVEMSPSTLKLLRGNALPKGNPLETARIAGIQAAKKTSDLIPLCHPLPLTHVDVSITIVRGGVQAGIDSKHKGGDRRRNGSAHGGRCRGIDAVRYVQGGGEGNHVSRKSGCWRRPEGKAGNG